MEAILPRRLERPAHGQAVLVAVLGHGEFVRFVERHERRILALDAQAERGVAVCARALDEGLEQRLADPASAPAGYDRDRELRGLLVDEAVAGPVALEEAVPGSADREAIVDRDEHGVARPPPPLHIPCSRPGTGARVPLAPVVGVVEHVAEEPDVLPPAPPDDHSKEATARAP